MPRPTLLVAEPEPLQALSVRKLVLETAKFNVLTAHTNAEALEVAEQFPNISGAIVVAADGMDCETLARGIKERANVPVIAVTPRIVQRCHGADHHVPSYEPEALVELTRKLFGDPRKLESETKQQP